MVKEIHFEEYEEREVGDFEAQNCLPAVNLIRSTMLHLTTEPPISCRCCSCCIYSSAFNFFCVSSTLGFIAIEFLYAAIAFTLSPFVE